MFSRRFYLSGVEVGNFDDAPIGTVIAFGDSITDGRNSTIDANHRWPDRLAERVAAITQSGSSTKGLPATDFSPTEPGPTPWRAPIATLRPRPGRAS